MMMFAPGKTMRLASNAALTGLLVLLLGGCAPEYLEQAPRPHDKRSVTIALWAGAQSDKRDALGRPVVDTVTGSRANRTIKGPFQWTHPKTGKKLWVYERVNRNPAGDKRQLFAVNADRTGLGRVYDSRPGQPDRYFSGDAIFPLGEWKRGEERTFRLVEYTPAGPIDRMATIKIRRLSYTYKNVPDSLKFDWILRDVAGKVLFHENYIYSPRKSLVRFRDRLKDKSAKG